MVVDTSAIVALLLQEDSWQGLERSIEQADEVSLSAATYVELFVVLTRRFGDGKPGLANDWLKTLDIAIVPFDVQQALIAREAYQRFGKGRRPAARNFATASAMRWQSTGTNHCSSKAKTFTGRMC